MSKHIIELKELTYSYDNKALALDNVSLTIEKGCVNAIIGGNGAGKSTLFLLLNGVLKADSGKIIYDGLEVEHNKKTIAELRKNIGIVFQDPNDQVFSATVYDDIAFGLVNLGHSESVIKAKVDEVANLLSISHLLDNYSHALSFGQKKRVALAGVLVMEPKVIILDEPTAGLDPAGIKEMLQVLNIIKEKYDVTVILSTHDIDLIPLYCDYAHVFSGGKVIMHGKPSDIFAQAKQLRDCRLRLPRITHLFEILRERDNMSFGSNISTISQARKAVKDVAQTATVFKSGKMLKYGYTTGTCATAATYAGVRYLLTNEKLDIVNIKTPSGKNFDIEVLDYVVTDKDVTCSVRKDSGDDPDVTHGMTITATVNLTDSDYTIEGGKGVGRVTRKGLACDVGMPAINPVPRAMIISAMKEVSEQYNYNKGVHSVISAIGGEDIARRTFNPRLGIVDGLSILGTTGVVEPMSEKALVDSIRREIDVRHAENPKTLLLCIGNYGKEFVQNKLGLDISQGVKCSNFIGEALEYAAYKNIDEILLVGHIGKLVKIAGGIMNTHSRMADCRAEIFSAHACLNGADKSVVESIMNAITTEEIDEILINNSLNDKVYKDIIEKIIFHMNIRIKSHVVVFTNKHGGVYMSDGVEEIANKLRGI